MTKVVTTNDCVLIHVHFGYLQGVRAVDDGALVHVAGRHDGHGQVLSVGLGVVGFHRVQRHFHDLHLVLPLLVLGLTSLPLQHLESNNSCTG